MAMQMQQDHVKEKMPRSLLRTVRHKAERKGIRRDHRGYVRLWEVVNKTEALRDLDRSTLIHVAWNSHGQRGYRFKMREATAGDWLIKARNCESRYVEQQMLKKANRSYDCWKDSEKRWKPIK